MKYVVRMFPVSPVAGAYTDQRFRTYVAAKENVLGTIRYYPDSIEMLQIIHLDNFEDELLRETFTGRG
jgi:hypothetical protein